MTELLHVAPKPCNTCPYARSTPPGIWIEDEYAKLPLYDDDNGGEEFPTIATFHCHQEQATGVDTVCRGWLGTHVNGIAVRYAVMVGRIDGNLFVSLPDEDPTLYATGAEAYVAGVQGIEAPSSEAQRRIRRLLARGVGQ